MGACFGQGPKGPVYGQPVRVDEYEEYPVRDGKTDRIPETAIDGDFHTGL